MHLRLIVMLLGLGVSAGSASAQTCARVDDLHSLGIAVTQQGGLEYQYEYAPLSGGALMAASLTKGKVADVWRENMDFVNGFHLINAGAGVARVLAPDAVAAMGNGAEIRVKLGELPAGVAPVPGQGWQGAITATVILYDTAKNVETRVEVPKLDVRYQFLAEEAGKIDGCAYRVIPVEFTAALDGKVVLRRRSLYFPELGVDVMTIFGPDADGPRQRLGVLRLAPA